VRAYAAKVASGKASAEELDRDTFSSHLYTVDLPDPDLIIRTSGEHRLSNFLLLQAAYAEIYVTPEPWPEFTADKFHLALQDYAGRERRYGKTGDQIRLKPTISETPVSV
nr:undecaprenyl diphosphate synthase family protein [Verrucomicrobiota bacterium]